MSKQEVFAALDVGNARIGVALARLPAALAAPLVTLPNDRNFQEKLQEIISTEGVTTLIVGLPRGLEGQETQQTTAVRNFVAELQAKLKVPVRLQDEALTSKQAESELVARGTRYNKGMVDALAATYILEDFLRDYQKVTHG